MTYSSIQERILQRLSKGRVERDVISKDLNTPRTTLYDNLVRLMKRKLVSKSSYSNGKRGRPYTLWSLTSKGMREVSSVEVGSS